MVTDISWIASSRHSLGCAIFVLFLLTDLTVLHRMVKVYHTHYYQMLTDTFPELLPQTCFNCCFVLVLFFGLDTKYVCTLTNSGVFQEQVYS